MTIFAVDLGNSRMKVAVFDAQGSPTSVPNDVGELSTPSDVFVDGEQFIIGKEAQNAGLAEPEHFIQNWKRHMGTDEVLYTTAKGRSIRAKDVAQALLEQGVRDVERDTGNRAIEAVVTIPANYNQTQRNQTEEAAKAAGILRTVVTPHEPTAAAWGNRVHERGDGLVAVFDLGGCTYDVSIVSVSGNTMAIKATGGEPKLGGQDCNARLRELYLDGFENAHGFRPSPDEHPLVFQDLEQRVEAAKLTLSVREKASVTIACAGKVLAVTVTRDEFEKAIADLIEKAMDCAERTLAEAGVQKSEIREFIPMGGGSQMPGFLSAIEKRFGQKASLHVDPHFAAALGALVVGRITKEEQGESVEVNGRPLPRIGWRSEDVTAHAIGVAVVGDGGLINSVVLAKGKRLPSDHTQGFTLAERGGTGADVIVCQGEDMVPIEECHELGQLQLRGLEPLCDRDHPVDVRIQINRNGVVAVKAWSAVSKKEEAAEFSLSSAAAAGVAR